MTTEPSLTLHASCVAVDGRGVLILGPSGAGKSALALQLMAFGAELVSDDRTELRQSDAGLMATSPPALRGLIEARGLGILHSAHRSQAEIALAVDLSQTETERLPLQRHVTYLGQRVALVLGLRHDHFPASILCYLRGGRHA